MQTASTPQPRKPRQPPPPLKKQPPQQQQQQQPGDGDGVRQQPIRRSTVGSSKVVGGNNAIQNNRGVAYKPAGLPATKQQQQQQQQKSHPTIGRRAENESKSERQSRASGGSMSGSLQGDSSSPTTPSSSRRASAAAAATATAVPVSPVQRSPVRLKMVMTMNNKTSSAVYMNKPPPTSSPIMRKPTTTTTTTSGDRSVNSLGNKSLGNNRSPVGGGGGGGGGGAPLSPRRQPRRNVIDPSSNGGSSSNSTGGNRVVGPARGANLNSPAGKKRRPTVARVGGDGFQAPPSAPIHLPTAASLLTPRRTTAAGVAAIQGEETWAAFEPDQWPDIPLSASCSASGSGGGGGGGGFIPTTSSSDDGDAQRSPPLARRKQRRPLMPQQPAAAGEKSSSPTASPLRATTSLKAKLEITGGFRPSQYFNSNIEGVCSMGEPSLSLEKATSKSPKSYKQGLAGRHDSVLSSWGDISAMDKKERADESSTGPPPTATATATAAAAATNNNNNNNTATSTSATNTSTTGNPNGVYIMPTAQTKLYEYARNCQWDDVTRELQESPRDAKCVGEKDGTTALHLAVMSRSNPMMRDGKMGEEYQPAPLSLVDQLIQACPEAAIIRCARKRYTPLSYACLVADRGYSMDDAAEMVEILLKHAPDSAFVFTDDGFSALDVHILSYSRFHKQKEEVYSGGRTSTVVLRTLLAQQPSLAEARVYRNKIRGPIELLYRCNTQEFRDALEEETGLVDDAVLIAKKKKQRFGSVMSVLTDWWAWKWALVLLKFASLPGNKPGTMFQAVHAAARMVGCPLPIIALAVNTFPLQVTERDPRNDLYNLPLHEVCSWQCDQVNVAGDPLIASRKFKAIQCLVEEFPDATRMTNNMGETPLQLAIETCTPWHGGLELLVEACPKALKFPRKLRRDCDAGYSLSVQNHSALASVNSFDTDRTDPMLAMEGMYPFLIAAVLGGVAPHKQRAPVSYSDEMVREHEINLQKKSLQSVRSIFGLLRARPQLLQKYRETVTQEFLEMQEEEQDEEEECSVYDDDEYDEEYDE